MIRKNIFLILSIAIIFGIVVRLCYSHLRHKDKFSFRSYDIESADFFGVNAQGKHYNLKADYVIKIGKDNYKLDRVYAKYYLDKNREKYTEVFSKVGFFNERKNLLDLKGDVEFILSHGYRMLTDNFFIDMNTHIAHTTDEAFVSGAQGKVLSKGGVTVYMKNKRIVFNGPIQSAFVENEVLN